MKRKSIVQFCAAAVAVLAFTPCAAAQSDFPDRPIRMLVGFSPGGPTDIVARVLAQRMSQDLGQNVLIENRPGANGNIAASEAANADADGYTILYNTSAIAISPSLFPDLDYDINTSFEPVALTALVPLVLEVNPNVPAQTVDEFAAYLETLPEGSTYSSTGNGSITHLAVALFLRSIDQSSVHVPYPGSAPALLDLSAGMVEFMMDTVNSSLPFLRDGRLRALAVTSEERLDVLPDVPTLLELGLQDTEIGAWQGILAPAGTPAEVVERLNASALAALEEPDVIETLAAQATTPLGSTPEEYGQYIQSEVTRWAEVVEENDVRIE